MISFISDCHFEHYHPDKWARMLDRLFEPVTPDRIIVTIGDMMTLSHSKAYYWYDLFQSYVEALQSQWVLIAGNHEYYGTSIHRGNTVLTDFSNRHDHVHFLNNDVVSIDGISFIGGTAWSDVQSVDGISEISDFSTIEGLTPVGCSQLYQDWFNFMKHQTTQHSVVLTHFVPSSILTPTRFKHDRLNGYFCNGVLDSYHSFKPDYWLYGHNHVADDDQMIDNIRCMTRQHGYPSEYKNGQMSFKTFHHTVKQL